jgi:benzoyl-CoA reductase/2-hydroxyglutaryl-CoA dehydratase subunit BcrC/BadD/HgdB
MSRIEEIISQLADRAGHPARAVDAAVKETGKKAVGCFPYYTPDEIVYAAGFLPVGLWGGQTDIKLADMYLQSFCCSIMRINMEQGMKGFYDSLAAVMIPIFCDTLKCICDNWTVAVPQTRLLPIYYPQHRRIAAGMAFMRDEYRHVQGELEKLAGRKIAEKDLEEAIALYDDYRSAMRQFTALAGRCPLTLNARTRHAVIKAAYFMDKKIYTPLVRELSAELEKRPPEDFRGIKVVVTGIMAEPDILLDAFVQNGIAFAADDLAQESRQFRTVTRSEGTAIERLAFRIADHRGCSLLFDEKKERGQMLVDLVRETKADGVVVSMMKFCNPEEFDYPVFKKELEAAKIPVLYLEIEQKMDSIEQLRTRIQSFAEMLRV